MGKLETRPRSLISGNICFKFSLQCLCSVGVRGDSDEKRLGSLYNSALPVRSHTNKQKINSNYWLVFNLSILVMRGNYKLRITTTCIKRFTVLPNTLSPTSTVGQCLRYSHVNPILVVLEVLPATHCPILFSKVVH